MPKDEMGYCFVEHKMKKALNFYKGTNRLHKSGSLCICKECLLDLEKYYLNKYDNIEYTIYLICANCDVPFLREAFNDFEAMVVETGRDDNFFYAYLEIAKRHIKRMYGNKPNINVGFELSDTVVKRFDSRSDPVRMSSNRMKWGDNLPQEHIDYLESRWQVYTDGLDMTPAQEQLYRNLCIAELDIWKRNDVDKAQKRQVDLMKALGINNFRTGQGKSLAEQMIENDIYICENEEPAEYYKDKNMYKDFRGIHSSWTKEILRPVLNFITGSREYDISRTEADSWIADNPEEGEDDG